MTECRSCPFLATCTKDNPEPVKDPLPSHCPDCGGLMGMLADGRGVACLECGRVVLGVIK